MERQATEQDFNNAGAVCMRYGHIQAAWDLFKGALEFHLAREKKHADPSVTLSGDAETFISRARERYNIFMSSNLCAGADFPSLLGVHGEDENFCHLFLFRNPYEISSDLPEDSIKASFSGLVVILNLAILEQYRNPSSKQVISLYRLAASLLSGRPTEAWIELVIANNVGVWHQQNGDVSFAEKYMKRVATISQTLSHDHSSFTLAEWGGVAFNLHWFAEPRFKISPAA